MNTQKKSLIIKLIIKILLLCLLVSMSTVLINISLNTKSTLFYNANGNIDYKVYLKENNFYKDRYLGEGMTYVTSLVDYIDIDFNYNFDVSEKADIDCNYNVFAKLVITPEDNSKVLFNEKYILKSEKVVNNFNDSNKYNLSQEIKLDYNYYNDLANTFKSTYGVNCNSKLYVGLEVDTKGKDTIYQTDFKNLNNMEIVFSLAKKQVDINTDAATLNVSENLDVESEEIIKNKGSLLLGAILVVVAIVMVISIVRTILNLRNQKDGYTRYIDKILNNYDRAIVETQYIPDLEEYEVIEVNKFSELLDVRDTLRLPIIYSPIKENESCFYIRQDSVIYMHYVKSTSLVTMKKFDSLFM